MAGAGFVQLNCSGSHKRGERCIAAAVAQHVSSSNQVKGTSCADALKRMPCRGTMGGAASMSHMSGLRVHQTLQLAPALGSAPAASRPLLQPWSWTRHLLCSQRMPSRAPHPAEALMLGPAHVDFRIPSHNWTSKGNRTSFPAHVS